MHQDPRADAFVERAEALVRRGEPRAALDLLEAALREFPIHVPVLRLLAGLRADVGPLDVAIDAARRYRAASQGAAHAESLLGHLLMRAGGADEEAARTLQAALRQDPRDRRAWRDLGYLFHRNNQHRNALQAYSSAAELGPADYNLHFNAGVCLDALDDAEGAAAHYRAAAALQPDEPGAHARLAYASARLCDWEEEARQLSAVEGLLHAGAPAQSVEPWLTTFLAADADAARQVVSARIAQLPARAPRPSRAASPVARPMRVGYLSPDFGQHAVGALVCDVFARHDRAQVSVHCYATHRHVDAINQAIRAGADTWRDLAGLATEAAADLIRADDLDVLVDLGGFTRDARPELLRLGVAPRLLGYLGYLGEYGGLVDAVVLDAWTLQGAGDTPALDLGTCLLPGSRPQPLPPRPAGLRSAFGLPEDAFVFASFNATHKLDAALVGAWVAIHRAVPAALFLVYLPDAARPRFVAHWQAMGGDPAALRLVGAVGFDEQARRMACADVFLDAFRHHAGATAVMAAAAGVPILCRAGGHPAARLSASLNGFLGLDDLVVAAADDYVAQAVALASAQAAGAAASRLREAAGARGLFDPARTARALERLYRGLG